MISVVNWFYQHYCPLVLIFKLLTNLETPHILCGALFKLVVDHQQHQVNRTAEYNDGGAGRKAEGIT